MLRRLVRPGRALSSRPFQEAREDDPPSLDGILAFIATGLALYPVLKSPFQ